MQKTDCPSCLTTLKLPEGFPGGTIKCPKCGAQFISSVDSSIESTSGSSDDGTVNSQASSSDVESADPGESAVNDQDFRSTGGVFSTVFRNSSAFQKTAQFTRRSPRLLDFRFDRYQTPTIIRISWICVLVFSVLWLMFMSLVFAGSFFSGGESSASVPNPSIDINDIMNGENTDLSSLTGLLGGLGSASSKPESAFESFKGFVFKVLGFLTLVASLILSVLWCRVMFETIIVIFDINNSLKSIDQKSDRVSGDT